MVEVDGVGIKYVVAICCRGVDVLVEFTGVEGGVVVTADGERDGVRKRPVEIRVPCATGAR